MATIDWAETYPQYMPEGVAFIAISDGTCTHCAVGFDIDALIASYAATYAFNSPGEVRCVAKLFPVDWNGEDPAEIERSFIIHSAEHDDPG